LVQPVLLMFPLTASLPEPLETASVSM